MPSSTNRVAESPLPVEDGGVCARALPIDRATAEIAHRTATFALG